eukprot:457908-Rhodomonas_salina.2
MMRYQNQGCGKGLRRGDEAANETETNPARAQGFAAVLTRRLWSIESAFSYASLGCLQIEDMLETLASGKNTYSLYLSLLKQMAKEADRKTYTEFKEASPSHSSFL